VAISISEQWLEKDRFIPGIGQRGPLGAGHWNPLGISGEIAMASSRARPLDPPDPFGGGGGNRIRSEPTNRLVAHDFRRKV
jgi:hypothetical protein